MDRRVVVESIDRNMYIQGLARYTLAPAELDDLNGLPSDEHHTRFMQYWTLKELYIRAGIWDDTATQTVRIRKSGSENNCF